MKNRMISLLCVLALALCLTACGEEETTTLTGMVVAVDGTVISLQQFDEQMQQKNAGGEVPSMPADGEMPSMPADGEMPSMPADLEGAEAPEEFDPENMEGTMPSDMQGRPEGGTPPELEEGETRPEMEEGEMPTGEADGEMPDFGMRGEQGESITIDLANAHISVEIDEGKATGSMEDITVGAFLTITMNADGEATNVVVSSMSGLKKGFDAAGE